MITNINKYILLENIRQAKEYIKKLGIDDPNEEQLFVHIKNKLESVPNLIGHFVKMAYTDPNVSSDTLDEIMNWVVHNRDLVGKLPKNINQYKTFEELEDHIRHLKQKLQINKFYKSLYKSMRDAVDKLDEEERIKFDDLALSFMALDEEKRENFTPLKYFEANNITIKEFMEAIENFIESETVNDVKKEVFNKLEKYEGKYKIVYNKNNVLAIQSNNKELVCELGSQNWCIVYNPNVYADSYFGPNTDNTQFIVYNFNLPSSSANSMFGVTVDENGNPKYGGSQNKRNQEVTLEQIYDWTGMPNGTLSPTEEIKKRIEDKKKINEFLKDVNNIEELYDFYKNNDVDKDLFLNIIQSSINIKTSYNRLILNTFKDKELSYVISLFNDKTFKELVFISNEINMYKTLFVTSFKLPSDIFYYITMHILIKLDERDKIYNFIENINRSILEIIDYNKDYDNIINKLDPKREKLKNIFNKINTKQTDEFIINLEKTFKSIRDRVLDFLLNCESNEIEFNNFTDYKKLYDKYHLPKEITPYENIYSNELIEILMLMFYDDEDFQNFIINLINKNKDDIDENKIIIDFIRGAYWNDAYYKLNDSSYSKSLTNIIKGTGVDLDDIVDKNNIVGLFLYRNMDKYDDQFIKNIGILKDSGQTYVKVSDFSEFDDLLFESEYFSNLEDMFSYFDYYDVDDYTLESWYDDLDDYNIIAIGLHMMKDIGLKKYYSINTINDNIVDSENIKVDNKPIKVPNKNLLNKYNTTEDIKKLRKDLSKLIFNINDVSVGDEDLMMYEDQINDEIKNDLIYKALMQSEESAQFDYIFNSLIEKVGDVLGSYDWEETQYGRKSIFKYDNGSILFTVSVDKLLYIIDDYENFNYNYGDEFKWEDILKYYKEQEGKIDMSYTYEKASYESPSRQDFNDAFRNL